MCQWCVEHGDGKKWYLNIRNYINKELFDSREEIRTAADMHFRDSERMFGIDMKKGMNYDKWLLDCLPFECIGCRKCESICSAGAVKLIIT